MGEKLTRDEWEFVWAALLNFENDALDGEIDHKSLPNHKMGEFRRILYVIRRKIESHVELSSSKQR